MRSYEEAYSRTKICVRLFLVVYRETSCMRSYEETYSRTKIYVQSFFIYLFVRPNVRDIMKKNI